MYSIKRWFTSSLVQALIIVGSASVAPALADAATYYVAKTGSDSTSCAQANSVLTPKLTIREGLNCLAAGDTLIVKSGTYNDSIPATLWPSGTSFAHTSIIGAGPTTIIQPHPGNCTPDMRVISIASKSWLELADMVLDSTNCNRGLNLVNVNDSLFRRLEIKNARNDGIHLSGGILSARNTFRDIIVHDNGEPGVIPEEHGFYHSCAIDTIIEHSEFYNNGSHGIHGYCVSSSTNHRMIVRYNYIHHNTTRGLLVGSGSDSLAHHNIITGNGTDGINVGFNATSNSHIYNNTIYSNRNECIEIKSESSNVKIKNNLCLDNGRNIILNNGTAAVIANNLLSTDSTLVVDVKNREFTPRVGSVLIDTGEYISNFSSEKFLGLAPDIGAVEFIPPQPSPIPVAPTSLKIGTTN
jgi:hypothetical protein